ncbi:hypothetical protein KSP40_PGU007763 [Platanthera guangdongensis]|uniref:PX domain-containing protein n=1 Tax=Platanthera guangdongensis TaxID=2320717 RepID=A0ABR2MAS3_9ASPA
MESVSDYDAPPYPSDDGYPLPDRCSDADIGDSSPTASNYSSCDGSDFDRYCSANSVLGSASICSSIGNYSGIGEELASEGYSSRGKSLRSRWNEYECFSDRGGDAPGADDDSSLTRMNAGHKLNKDSVESSSSDFRLCGEDNPERLLLSCFAKGGKKYEEKDSRNEELWKGKKETYLDLNSGSMVGIEANGYVFSQSNLSGSEDSMLAYGTDDEDNELNCCLNSLSDGVGREVESSHGEDYYGKGMDEALGKTLNGESEACVSTISSSRASLQSYHVLNGESEEIRKHELEKHSFLFPLSNTSDDSSIQRDQEKDLSSPHLAKADCEDSEISGIRIKKLDTNDSYDEMVLEMEEILLDSRKCHGSMRMQVNQGLMRQQSPNVGDDSSIASTSSVNDIFPPVQVPLKFDRVEVIGAKQKKGDVSFGERLVGVREYTLYQMKVWSGTDEWMVERRYRDFFTLYCQLKALFSGHGLNLPSAWSSVEQESRKIFGNASPNVVMERSILIEECLRSILNSTFHSGTPSPLTMFLTPGKAMFKPGLLQSLVPQYLQKFSADENPDCHEVNREDSSLLGTTISLVVEIKPYKSLRQLLEIQHYTCAGCHRRLDAVKTLFQELVQTFGWNRPRFCEYTGQLFCASCHTNDTSVLPARVLHHWDFTKYPVSQLAKAYLESIYDQPMLCVSAVNPFLFSKVPALLHVMDFRKKIGAKFPYVNCPFKNSIQKSLGFRRHLLESNDFFALRDLVDLSKGPFAATQERKTTAHIKKPSFSHLPQVLGSGLSTIPLLPLPSHSPWVELDSLLYLRLNRHLLRSPKVGTREGEATWQSRNRGKCARGRSRAMKYRAIGELR